MEEVIKQIRKLKGYRIGDQDIKILCFADDAVLITESENDIQGLLFQFNKTASKTKRMTTSKAPIRCKIGVDD